MVYLTDTRIEHQTVIDRVLRSTDGGIAFFAGVVRDHHEGKAVESIFYDAYREMAEKEIDKIVRDIAGQFPDTNIAVVHRLGLLHVGDTSIAIACASSHRAEAFTACRQIIDRIKLTVPIWKKERGPDGEEWVGWQGRP